MTTRPHDALFKSAFEAPADAGALVRELLPAAVRDAVVWDSLDREPGSFVDATLTDRHSDLLFSARLRAGDPERIFILLEHSSSADPAMPLRMLAYQARIWERFRREHPGSTLPPVIAVLICHVPGGWPNARSFEAMFDPIVMEIPGLAELTPRFSLSVDDLAHLSDEDLKARSLPAFQKLALWLLRDGRDPDRLLANFGTWDFAMIEVIQSETGIARFAGLISYLFRVVDPSKLDELRAKLRALDIGQEDRMMSIADYFHEQGREKGHAEGHAEGRIATLRRLILIKFDTLEPEYDARLRAAQPEAIDRYIERVLFASSPATVFAD